MREQRMMKPLPRAPTNKQANAPTSPSRTIAIRFSTGRSDLARGLRAVYEADAEPLAAEGEYPQVLQQ